MKHQAKIEALRAAVLASAGESPPELRRAVFERRLGELTEPMRHYVRTVQQQAYRVSDEDVQALKDAGYSEDFIFEITGSAALGAALYRMERALAVLEESQP